MKSNQKSHQVPNLKLLSNEAYGRTVVKMEIGKVSEMVEEAKKEAVYTSQMYTIAACLLALRDVFGFGKIRLARVAEKIIENVALQIDGDADVQKILDECDLDINFRNIASVDEINLFAIKERT